MANKKSINAKVTQEHYDMLMEFGSINSGIDQVLDSYFFMAQMARSAIQEQKFTPQELKALTDPIAMRVNLFMDDHLLGVTAHKHGAEKGGLKAKLNALGQLEVVFLSDEFRKYDFDKLVEMYSEGA